MIKIGLLSDTHAWWDDRYVTYFSGCDEIWHAGDIGSETLALQLASIKTFRAVHGNIDGYPLRIQYPRVLRFKVEEVEVLITHIGGYPGRYAPEIREELFTNPPQLFIAGHSHILKAQYDPKLQCMHLNPGAAGKSGFHKVRTLMRFVIDGKQLKDLEVIELGNE
jgi:putative phosphoesterase